MIGDAGQSPVQACRNRGGVRPARPCTRSDLQGRALPDTFLVTFVTRDPLQGARDSWDLGLLDLCKFDPRAF